MRHVPEIKLIRTDTTLDLSQKAEKVCLGARIGLAYDAGCTPRAMVDGGLGGQIDKNIRHLRFPRGPPPQYWAGPMVLNFGVRMGSGGFTMVWAYDGSWAIFSSAVTFTFTFVFVWQKVDTPTANRQAGTWQPSEAYPLPSHTEGSSREHTFIQL